MFSQLKRSFMSKHCSNLSFLGANLAQLALCPAENALSFSDPWQEEQKLHKHPVTTVLK